MSKKILVIENDPDVREIVSLVLEEEGYSVTATKHIPMEDLSASGTHLIVLDEWLPNNVAGHLFCLKIKEVHELMHIPIIILSTAHNIEEIACACKADGFVSKPFDLDTLLAEVKRCCSPQPLIDIS